MTVDSSKVFSGKEIKMTAIFSKVSINSKLVEFIELPW